MNVKQITYSPDSEPLSIKKTSRSDDRQLWRNFKNGSESSYALIYRHFFFPLYHYGLKICYDKEIVKDCLQDLFVDIWKNKENLSDTDSIKYYLFTALKRRLIDCFAKSGKVLYGANFDAVLESEAEFSVEQQLICDQVSEEQKKSILIALNRLTERQKEAIVLKFYDNLPSEEIASQMAISVEAVYNIVSKALGKMRKNVSKIYVFILFLSSLN
jgi:RNA polymerase sigma factor (sigma-70 family)